MTHTRKKLLLRDDEVEMIEFALDKVAGGFERVEEECSAMQIFARSAADKAKYEASEKKAQEVAAEIKRILKLVQDAEATETVVEL